MYGISYTIHTDGETNHYSPTYEPYFNWEAAAKYCFERAMDRHGTETTLEVFSNSDEFGNLRFEAKVIWPDGDYEVLGVC